MANSMIELAPGAHLAVSSGSFLDLSRPIPLAVGAVIHRPHLRELEDTYQAAVQLGLLTEYVYRVQGVKALKEYADSRTVSFHFPVFGSLERFREHKFGFAATLKNGIASDLVLGWVDTEWGKLQQLVEAFPNRVLVAHPDVALWLAEKLPPDSHLRRLTGVEADWMSVENSPRLISDDTKVIEIIDAHGFGANPDTSHKVITANPPLEQLWGTLADLVDIYGQRIRRIHFSGNVHRPAGLRPTDWLQGASLPLNSELITDEVSSYHEWYRYLDSMAKQWGIAVPVSLEIYTWKKGADYDVRLRGIEATMEGLLHGKVEKGSRSYKGRPTKSLTS